MNLKLIISLILAGLAVIFIIQNVAVVKISFLFWSIQMSRALLIFILLVVGIILGWIFQSYFKRRKSAGIK